MIRTFNLMNSEGAAYTLTIANKYNGFLSTVDGLGYEEAPEYQQIGNNYDRLMDNINQGVISGIIQFFNPYEYQAYSRFALFCQDKKLTLYYRTPTGLYKRDGSITKIEKSEGKDSLKVKIEFTATSLWYQEIEQTASGTSITIISESAIESPCHVTFKPSAAITALTWSHAIDGVTKITGGLTGISVSTSQTLHIRTDTNPYKIYRNTEATNYYSKSDFSKKRFILLGKGTNVITFNTSGTIGVEGRILYETV